MATKQIGTVKSVIDVERSELEQLVYEVYGKDIPELSRENYDFVHMQECGNDSTHEFNIDGKLDKYEIENWNRRDFMYRNHLILNKLCSDGYICPGCYMVSVCW